MTVPDMTVPDVTGPTGIVPSVGAARFDPTFLERLRAVGDPEADAAITTFFDDELDAPATGLMQALITHAPGSDEASAVLGAFVDERPVLPDWADPDLMTLGQELFAEFVPQFGLALWMASIPAGYAGARDAVVLQRTAELVSHPKRRFLETGQFVIDVMTAGGLAPDGAGTADIRHVRLMHAAVRYMLQHEAADLGAPAWDPSDGVPLNQEALLATQFTFSVVGLRSLKRFGVNISEREAEAYIHLWSVIGHLMGVRADLLPLDHAASEVVWDRIMAKEYATSDGGKVLTAAAIEVMRDMLPGRLGDGLPASGIRFLLGNDTADLLGVPRSNWTAALFLPGRVLGGIVSRLDRDSAVGRSISAALGRQLFKGFLEIERGPTRPGFEVPEELRRQLGLE